MAEDVKERLLRKFISPCSVSVEGSDFEVGGGGWQIITATDSDGNPTYWALCSLLTRCSKKDVIGTTYPPYQEEPYRSGT